MIGYNWDYTPAPQVSDEDAGRYYCGCRYQRDTPHCVHHGDPVEHWPKPPKDQT